jgi:hypothetical protein
MIQWCLFAKKLAHFGGDNGAALFGFCKEVVDRIYGTVKDLFSIAKQGNTTTHQAAASVAESRIRNGVGARTEPARFPHWPSDKIPLI